MSKRVLHVDEQLLRRLLEAVNDQAARYWCWLREDYEAADRLRCEVAELLGEPREPRPWPQ